MPEKPDLRLFCYSLADSSHSATIHSVSENAESSLSSNVSTSIQSTLGSPRGEAVVNSSQKSTLAVEDMRSCSETNFQQHDNGNASDDNTITRKYSSKPDFRLQPGSYTIVLCIDNQEIYSRYVIANHRS